MHTSFKTLLANAYKPLCDAAPSLSALTIDQAGHLASELEELLFERNGFFAFGPALHVFPSASTDLSWGLVEWNMPGLWKHEYQHFVDPGLCFAEDVFGNQFSIRDGNVHYFEVETGGLKTIAASLSAWADLILSDHQFWTGSPIAQRWAEHAGPIPLHKRLQPGTPFVCGGRYDVDNLCTIDAAELMAYWGRFARQIHVLPDGAEVRISVSEDPAEQA